MTVSTDANPTLTNEMRPYWTECGEALKKFHTYRHEDPMMDTVLLPVVDGITLIKWKQSLVLEG